MQLRRDRAWDLDPESPIGPQLHRILRERIVRNDLISGSKISEPEVAKYYSISRQPVREAFIKLSEEGLISIRPQRSTVIKKIDSEAVLQARFVREAIEADIVKLLATRSDPVLVRELRAQLAEQERVAAGNPAQFIRLDERFHRTLAEASDNAGAWKFVEGLKSQMDRVRFLSLSFFPMPKLIAQHKAVVDCIETGDLAQAESAIRLHLKEILTDLPEIQAVNPEFFSQVSE
ncbi:DNA-binding GntR family transcriptional regulator [Litoreibacter meonggei]|uniref:DNA-binding GntR family transcriptional regulator n=1 Tax=Litoreibacter meonggei TaxID=1049199 RepID=A0A497VFL5_9RHOB|nr:GntR family transcriptional regulator [Litoreibacter meonggei]RLJ41007.1 DNA-binding GntR family transcriptional regulator [Litoreibacter meonggei]